MSNPFKLTLKFLRSLLVKRSILVSSIRGVLEKAKKGLTKKEIDYIVIRVV